MSEPLTSCLHNTQQLPTSYRELTSWQPHFILLVQTILKFEMLAFHINNQKFHRKKKIRGSGHMGSKFPQSFNKLRLSSAVASLDNVHFLPQSPPVSAWPLGTLEVAVPGLENYCLNFSEGCWRPFTTGFWPAPPSLSSPSSLPIYLVRKTSLKEAVYQAVYGVEWNAFISQGPRRHTHKLGKLKQCWLKGRGTSRRV